MSFMATLRAFAWFILGAVMVYVLTLPALRPDWPVFAVTYPMWAWMAAGYLKEPDPRSWMALFACAYTVALAVVALLVFRRGDG